MTLARAYARLEALQLLRVPVYAFSTLVFPVVGLVLFGQ